MTEDEAKAEIEKAGEIILDSVAHLPPPIAAVAMVGALAAQATLANFNLENVINALRSAWADIHRNEAGNVRITSE
jgi:hypothetical protein